MDGSHLIRPKLIVSRAASLPSDGQGEMAERRLSLLPMINDSPLGCV